MNVFLDYCNMWKTKLPKTAKLHEFALLREVIHFNTNDYIKHAYLLTSANTDIKFSLRITFSFHEFYQTKYKKQTRHWQNKFLRILNNIKLYFISPVRTF